MEGISRPDFSNSDRVYYGLIPRFNQDTAIYIPVGSPKAKMGETMTRQEAEQFILTLSSIEREQYADDREGPQAYRQIPESDDCTQLASMIKEMLEMEQNRRGKGKLLSIREQDGVKGIRKLLFGELTTALDICLEEIPGYIINQIGEA